MGKSRNSKKRQKSAQTQTQQLSDAAVDSSKDKKRRKRSRKEADDSAPSDGTNAAAQHSEISSDISSTTVRTDPSLKVKLIGSADNSCGVPPPLRIDEKKDADESNSSLPSKEDTPERKVAQIWHELIQNGWLQSRQSTTAEDRAVPTPLQSQCWSILLQRKQLVGISPTGTGKTLAYAVPTVVSAMQDIGSFVLILVPTRELVNQVAKACSKVAKTTAARNGKSKCHIVTIYGGADKQEQEELLLKHRKKSRVVVSTPGRLADLFGDESIAKAYRNPKYILFDEADQLAKEDLAEQIDDVLGKVNKKDAVVALFSATFPKKIRSKLADWLATPYIMVQTQSIKDGAPIAASKSEDGESMAQQHSLDGCAAIPANIEQIVHVCAEHKKPKKLMHTLRTASKNFHHARTRPLGIVFFGRIEKLKYVSKLLQKDGINCLELHGQLPNRVRQQNLQNFSAGKCPIILATDLAARGIHVKAVRFCIHYDFPGNLEQYIHRCGRAGRDGKPAATYGFLTRNLQPLAASLIELLRNSNAAVDPNLIALAQDGTKLKTKKDKSKKMDNGNADDVVGDKNTTPKHDKKKKTKKMEAKPATTESSKKAAPSNMNKPDQAQKATKDDADDDIDEFDSLKPNRIVLKRAAHVSDASDSSDDDDDDDN